MTSSKMAVAQAQSLALNTYTTNPAQTFEHTLCFLVSVMFPHTFGSFFNLLIFDVGIDFYLLLK